MTAEVTISVVFTDLVGSTELSSRVGPQTSEELRQAHFALLREAISALDGTEVKNLGDGLMVVFPSLGRALDCAVAMQQAITRHNRRSDEPLVIRVGVGTGDATEEDGDYFGEPVVEASRLCAAAAGSQILTSDVVRALSRRSGHSFRSVGELELKGLPEPVSAYEVEWAAAAESALPLPGRLSAVPVAAYCGRAEERERIATLWKSVVKGERRLVLLAGEPGIGKTRLATEIAIVAHADGASVLYGRCDEDLGLPYQPFVEALSHYVEHAPDAVLAAHVDRHGGELTRLVSRLSARVPDAREPQRTDPETERYLLFGAVAGLLEEASTNTPIVLVLDDLHWADKQTMLLLKYLVHAPPGAAAVLVIGTYRDTDLSAGDPLVDILADLRREPSVERVALEGLGDDEVVEFLEQMAGHGMDRDGVALGHAIRRETAGNPFFIGEMLRHLAESGSIRLGSDGRWTATADVASIGLPESVREVVGRRLRRLPSEVFRALSVAAVIGQEFDLSTLCRVDEATEDDLLDALERAERAAIVNEVSGAPGRFNFVSALIQQTLYEDLSSARRARMHRRVGEALEAEWGDDPGDHIGELAHHWLAAVQPADTKKAIDYARRAGEQALRKLAPDDAVRWFSSALDLHNLSDRGDAAGACDILLGLGRAQRASGISTFRQTLLDATRVAEELGDADRLVQAALANNRGMFSSAGRVDADRVRVLEAALAAMPSEVSADRARLLGLLGVELLYAGDYPRRRALSDEAVSVARSVGDADTLMQVLAFRHETIRIPETLEERKNLLEEARSLSAANDPFWSYWVHSFSAHPALESGDIEAVDRYHDIARSIAKTVGQPVLAWHSAFHDSWRVLVGGDHAGSERLATVALEQGEAAGEPDAFTIFGTQLLCIRWHQGRLDELVDLLAQAAVDNPGIPAYKAAHALALVESGADEEARDRLHRAIAERFADVHQDNLWLAGMNAWGDVAVQLDDAESAPSLAKLLEPCRGQVATTGASVLGPVAHSLGGLERLLGDLDAAATLLEESRLVSQRLGAPFFLARSNVELARVLRDRDQPRDGERASQLLDQALQLAEAHGCALVERRARALVR